MSIVTLGVLVGCALGGACALLAYAVIAPRPSVGTAIARWERARVTAVAPAAAGGVAGPYADRQAARLLRMLEQRGIALRVLRTDLALLELSIDRHVARKVLFALTGFLAPTLLTGLAWAAGSTTSVPTPVLAGVIFAVIGFVLPDQRVHRQAEERRTAMREALSSYLDLVAMSLSGGRGVPEALPSAVQVGSGWAFEMIGDAISRARYLGVPPWRALSDLGAQVGVPELTELGRALMLVADDGSKVRTSLLARAASARQRQLAEAESLAEKADGSMNFALFVVFAGIFLFILYPAVAVVMAL